MYVYVMHDVPIVPVGAKNNLPAILNNSGVYVVSKIILPSWIWTIILLYPHV